MLPRLEAEEKLAAINVAALGAGAGEPIERARIFASLEQRASGAAAPAPTKADPEDLASMGIGVRMAEGEGAVITDRDAWLGVAPASSSEAVGGQENG